MKKNVLLLAALLALGMTACGSNNNKESAKQSTPEPASEVSSNPGSNPQSVPAPSSTPAPSSKQDVPSSRPTVPSSQPAPSSQVAPSSQTAPSSQVAPNSQPAQSSEPEEEQPQNKDLAIVTDIVFGGEADPGKFVYWYGEGGNLACQLGENADADYLIIDYTAGNQWYSGQIFVATPYAEAGDDVQVEFDLIPSVAGQITINQKVYDLKANEANHIKYRVTVGTNLRAIDLQFGKYEGNVVYPTSTFKVGAISIKPFNGVYHEVTFGMEMEIPGSEEPLFMPMLSYFVKDNKTLFYLLDTSAFEAFLQEGQVIKGWKDSEGNYASTSTVITKDTQYVLDIVSGESIQYRNVSYLVGDKVIFADKVADGMPASEPTLTWKEIGFGRAAAGFYDDAALTQAHDFTAPVAADQTIYVKKVMNPTTWVQWGWAPEATFEATENKYTASHLNCGTAPGNEGWNVQINFPNLPAETGYTYTLSFKYKLTALANGNCQAWDAPTSTGMGITALEADGQEHTVSKTYSGSDYAAFDAFEKMTIELGQCGADTTFEIYDLSIVAVAE